MALEGIRGTFSNSYTNLFAQRFKVLNPALTAISALAVLSAGVTAYASSRCVSALSSQEVLSELPGACEAIPYAGVLTFVLFSGAVLTYSRLRH